MNPIYNKYTVEDVKQLVELYYGESLFTTIHPTARGTKVPKGSDTCFELMENFLTQLDNQGLEIVRKDRNCKCGKK